MKKGGVSRMFEGWKGGIRGVEKLDFDWHWVFNWLSGWLIELIEVDWWCSMSWMRLIVVKSGCFRLLKWIVSVKKKSVCSVFNGSRVLFFGSFGRLTGSNQWEKALKSEANRVLFRRVGRCFQLYVWSAQYSKQKHKEQRRFNKASYYYWVPWFLTKSIDQVLTAD